MLASTIGNKPIEQAHEAEKRTRVEAIGLRDLGRLTLVYFDEIERG